MVIARSGRIGARVVWRLHQGVVVENVQEQDPEVQEQVVQEQVVQEQEQDPEVQDPEVLENKFIIYIHLNIIPF
jgi:hypothetical protein